MSVIPGLSAAPEAASRFVQFVNASPTPFHAVHNAALRLEKAGFAKVSFRSSALYLSSQPLQIREKDDWEANLKGGGKYYFTRYVALLDYRAQYSNTASPFPVSLQEPEFLARFHNPEELATWGRRLHRWHSCRQS